MAKTMKRLGEIRENVEADSIDVEKYWMELPAATMDLTKACRIMFVQEHFRFIAMFSATRTEHKVIMNLRAVSGDKSMFRQWHQKFTTALEQVGGAHKR